jgi:hypothetical protein
MRLARARKLSKWHFVRMNKVVANCEVRTEVSQTAVSVLTPYRVRGRLNRNYIPRPSGRMRYHMLPKSNTPKEESTEMVDVAAIGTGIFTLPRDVSNPAYYIMIS